MAFAAEPADTLPRLEDHEALHKALEPTPTEWGASRWGEYRRCHFAHHLRYHLRLVSTPRRDDDWDAAAVDDRPDTSYFELGQLVHAGHRWMREGVLAGERRPRDWRHVLAVATLDGHGHRAYDVGHVYEAERLLRAYYARWGVENAGFDPELRIVAVEHELRAPKGHRIAPYTARVDAILRNEVSGELIVDDDKTRGRAFPKGRRDTYARGLSTRPQFCGLSWLVWNCFEPASADPPAVWVNAIIKTKVPTCDRLVVPMTVAGLGRWEAMQADDARGGVASTTRCFESCAPEMGSRCWAFTWCHGTDEERATHFTRRDDVAETEKSE